MSPVPGGRGGEGAGITLCLQGTEEGRLEIKDLHAGEDVWEASAHVCWHFARPPLEPCGLDSASISEAGRGC